MLQLLPTIFCCSLLAGLLLTWAIRELATRARLVAGPKSDRHLHTRAIPRVGGVAIFGAFCISMLLARGILGALGLHDFNIGIEHTSLKAIIAASTLVFGVGLIDDLFDCPPVVKLICQVAAASFAFAGGVRIGSFPYLGQQFGMVVSFLITVAFIAFITNAFNLIDGMDGLATGSALVSTVALAGAAMLNHRNPAILITVGLAGALLSFLPFNFNPATIFLGDGGSLFIGFLLSCAAISGAQKLPAVVAVCVPMLIFAVPILDTALSIGRRTLRGQRIFAADRDHIHHRLLLRGNTQKQAALAVYGVSGVCASLMLLVLYRERLTVFVIIAVLIILAGFVARLRYPDFSEMRRALLRVVARRKGLSQAIRVRAVLQQQAQFPIDSAVAALDAAFGSDIAPSLVAPPYSPQLPTRAENWVFHRPLRDAEGHLLGYLAVRCAHAHADVVLLEECASTLEKRLSSVTATATQDGVLGAAVGLG